MSERYIGVMSGTSLDGVDIALCEVDANKCKLIHYFEYPYDENLKEEVLEMISTQTTLAKVGELDVKLGQLFADSINKFLEHFDIQVSEVNAIGLHGQTLWHAPEVDAAFSMQLGSANIVHAQTGIKVVADFRNMDMANGGQGAPFAPIFHHFLFSNLQEKTAVVNIGGIANIAVLGEKLHGWDTGPGNVFLDYWVKEVKHFPYDVDGEFARSGEVDAKLLEIFLNDPYFEQKPPKSTGREHFNWDWLYPHLQEFKMIPHENIQRTLLELSAKTISDALKNTDTTLAIICGGGSKNSFLLQRIQELSNMRVETSEVFGVSSSAMEAMAFAWFAYKRMHNEAPELRSVTGAKKNSILGGIYG